MSEIERNVIRDAIGGLVGMTLADLAKDRTVDAETKLAIGNGFSVLATLLMDINRIADALDRIAAQGDELVTAVSEPVDQGTAAEPPDLGSATSIDVQVMGAGAGDANLGGLQSRPLGGGGQGGLQSRPLGGGGQGGRGNASGGVPVHSVGDQETGD